MADYTELTRIATQVRRDIIRMVHGAKNGHPGGALGCADLLVLLYCKLMKFDTKNFTMDGKGEDMFFLSNGHISAVLYSTLARAGYFDPKELATHRKLNSRLQGHPTPHEGLPGIRIATGSLGQGLSVSIGAALAKRLNNDDRFVYCLMGDGEQQEGQVWEAAMYAPHNKVSNLIGFVDYNGIQIDGHTKDVLDLLDLGKKYEAFGWEVLSCDGNNIEELEATILKAQGNRSNGKPKMVIMHTQMGYPIDFMMGSHKWHGNAPNDEQKDKALAQLEVTIGDY